MKSYVFAFDLIKGFQGWKNFQWAKTTKCQVINISNNLFMHTVTILIFISSHFLQLSHYFISLFQMVFDIRIKAIKELKLMKELGNHLHLLFGSQFSLILVLKKIQENKKNSLGKTHIPTTQNGQILTFCHMFVFV